ENSPHGLGRGRKEMASIVPVRGPRTDKTQICFMNESGGLKGLALRQPRHPRRSEMAQLVVNQRKQFLGGAGIALAHAVEDARNIAHASRVCLCLLAVEAKAECFSPTMSYDVAAFCESAAVFRRESVALTRRCHRTRHTSC